MWAEAWNHDSAHMLFTGDCHTDAHRFFRKLVYQIHSMKNYFYPRWSNSKLVSIVSIMLRIVFGFSMLKGHGWRKLMMMMGDDPIKFADPIGLGDSMTLYLTVFAEVLCSVMLVIGLFTRGVVVPLIITMLVAILVVNLNGGFKDIELALVYLTAYASIWVVGPGKFSLDHVMFGRKE